MKTKVFSYFGIKVLLALLRVLFVEREIGNITN